MAPKTDKKYLTGAAYTLLAALMVAGGLEADRRLSAAPDKSVIGKAVAAWRNLGCVDAKTLGNPLWPKQKRLAQMYNDLSRYSPTAKATMDEALRTGMKYCLSDPEAKAPTLCGKKARGVFDIFTNEVDLDPEARFSDAFVAMVLFHETRHKIQTLNRLDTNSIINVRPWSRIAHHLFMEADARMMTIVIAHELGQAGFPLYMQALRENAGHRAMVEAFEDIVPTDGR